MQKLNKIDRADFLVNFLEPINKITKSCTIKVQPEHLIALCTDAQNGIVLFARYFLPKNQDIENDTKLNIGDTQKLIRVLNVLPSNEITFNIDTNYISYNSPYLNFKYHLLSDNVIANNAPISIEKIKKLDFDLSFDITKETLNQILKCTSFASETNKFYFYTKDDKVYGELTDHQVDNSDSISLSISDKFEGNQLKEILPINLEVFKNISGIKIDNIKIKVNTQSKILMFQLINDNVNLQYIISGLIK